MKILTFSGETPAIALKNVQQEIGEEAVVIETKEIRKKGIGRVGLYEIIVGIEEDDLQRAQLKQESKKSEQRAQEKQSIPTLKSESEDVLFNISKAAEQISKIADVTSSPNKTARKKEDVKEMGEIKNQIEKLSDKIQLIQHMFWDEKNDSNLSIPPEFSEIYKLAFQSGMKKDHLNEIISLTYEHMPSKMRENSQTVKRYFSTLLRKMIPIRVEKKHKIGGKSVVMLVGPTGVGKTTSIAKLAARYSFLMQKKYKVGLVVLDTYRIGAVEQVMQYARMMKLAIETVVDPSDFNSALEALSYCDYILIDTMGSSPYDQEKISKINECLLESKAGYDVDVVLVMPSSIKYEDMQATYDNFESLGVDTLMFSKLDESRSFGNIFSLVYETKKPISYFSIGQEVPEDLALATSDILIDCLLNGFDRSKIK